MQFSLLAFVYMTYLVFLTIYYEDTFTAEKIGIMFSYSVYLQKNVGYFFMACSDMENKMISMERCVEYTAIPIEKPFTLKSDKNIKHWPREGKIHFDNYSVRYRADTEIVLNKMSFDINSKEKVAIIGRTGSGKSTVALSLLRLIEPLSGAIYIDDIDIASLGLDMLRENITMIPQEPFIIEGTLKRNIALFGNCSDNEIFDILKNLCYDIKDKSELSKTILQNGSNISAGERQLINIARALLRRNSFVVMDEATSNIDSENENKINEYLHTKLQAKTVISIVHRIQTVMNYDKILV